LAAGTEGLSLGVEGIEVTLVKKGEKAPGTTANPFVKKIRLSPIAEAINGLGGYAPSDAVRLSLEKAIKVIKNQSYDVGFVLYDLATRKGVSYNANKGFYVASAIKAPYVASLAANNKSAFQSYQSTIKDILYYSSNDGYNLLRRIYGGVYMEKWMREAGVNPALAAPGYPYITANEMAKLWERNNLFFQNTTTGKQMASWYERPNLSPIRSMLGSQYNTKSKAGWIGMPGYHAANDAGIVSTPKGCYVLAIMSNADGKLGLLNELVLSLNNIYKSL
ncbi:serine hydrolase, partial [Streptococcus hyovaginalis]